MSEGYYRDPQFCLECAWNHMRDSEHHLDDWLKYAKDPAQKQKAEELRTKQREIRKQVDEWRLKLKGTTQTEECVGCSGIVNPEDLNPEELEKCTFKEEKVKPKEYFHPGSFRTLCPSCPETRCSLCPPELACASRIIIGCAAGKWDAAAKKCKVSTEPHRVIHGKPKP